MKQRIIVITAHPDDAELGMGMRIKKHSSDNDEVILIVATGGEYRGNNYSRYSENKKASKILGIKSEYFLGFKCGRLLGVSDELRTELERIIGIEQPELVYTIYPNDIHIDHEVLSKQAKIASRSIPNLIYFRVVNSLNFVPNCFFFGGEELFNIKIKAIECYVNEVKRKGTINLELLRSVSKSEYYHYFHHTSIKKIRNDLRLGEKDNLYCEMFYTENISII